MKELLGMINMMDGEGQTIIQVNSETDFMMDMEFILQAQFTTKDSSQEDCSMAKESISLDKK